MSFVAAAYREVVADLNPSSSDASRVSSSKRMAESELEKLYWEAVRVAKKQKSSYEDAKSSISSLIEIVKEARMKLVREEGTEAVVAGTTEERSIAFNSAPHAEEANGLPHYSNERGGISNGGLVVNGLSSSLKDDSTLLEALTDRVKTMKVAEKVVQRHKEFYKEYAQFSRNIEKWFFAEIGEAHQPVELDERALCKLISLHFLHQGKFSLYNRFQDELKTIKVPYPKDTGKQKDTKSRRSHKSEANPMFKISPEVILAYKELHNMREALKQENIDSALTWLKTRRVKDRRKRKNLIFQLHRLKYFSLLSKGSKQERVALEYCRRNLVGFWKSMKSEIAQLTTSLAFSNNAKDSPYDSFHHENAWEGTTNKLLRLFCEEGVLVPISQITKAEEDARTSTAAENATSVNVEGSTEETNGFSIKLKSDDSSVLVSALDSDTGNTTNSCTTTEITRRRPPELRPYHRYSYKSSERHSRSKSAAGKSKVVPSSSSLLFVPTDASTSSPFYKSESKVLPTLYTPHLDTGWLSELSKDPPILSRRLASSYYAPSPYYNCLDASIRSSTTSNVKKSFVSTPPTMHTNTSEEDNNDRRAAASVSDETALFIPVENRLEEINRNEESSASRNENELSTSLNFMCALSLIAANQLHRQMDRSEVPDQQSSVSPDAPSGDTNACNTATSNRSHGLNRLQYPLFTLALDSFSSDEFDVVVADRALTRLICSHNPSETPNPPPVFVPFSESVASASRDSRSPSAVRMFPWLRRILNLSQFHVVEAAEENASRGIPNTATTALTTANTATSRTGSMPSVAEGYVTVMPHQRIIASSAPSDVSSLPSASNVNRGHGQSPSLARSIIESWLSNSRQLPVPLSTNRNSSTARSLPSLPIEILGSSGRGTEDSEASRERRDREAGNLATSGSDETTENEYDVDVLLRLLGVADSMQEMPEDFHRAAGVGRNRNRYRMRRAVMRRAPTGRLSARSDGYLSAATGDTTRNSEATNDSHRNTVASGSTLSSDGSVAGRSSPTSGNGPTAGLNGDSLKPEIEKHMDIEGEEEEDDEEVPDGKVAEGKLDTTRVKLPLESPLAVILCAGFVALPRLLHVIHTLKQGGGVTVSEQKSEWLKSQRIPIELDLGPRFHFHSSFTCAVSRDQTHKENPAMLLTCGHAMCRSCVERMCSRRSRNTISKCPICPSEFYMFDAKQLYFD